MPGMDILNNGLRSLTGGITKAYIRFDDERTNDDVNVTTVGARTEVTPSRKLMTEANKAAKAVNSVSQAIGKVMAGAKKDSKTGTDFFPSGKVYEVKFNPSEVDFHAYGGGNVQKMNFTAKGKIQMSYVPIKPRIMMNVPLIFDDSERTDAFMAEKFTDPIAMTRTIAAGAANAITGSTYSVRPQVEGFIAALKNERTRKMTFFWGNLVYSGILEEVSAEYTMFNMEGHPIRAHVNLSILLIDEKVRDNNMGDWEDSYKKLFGKSSSLGSKVDSVGNLLNIKL